MCGAVLCLVAQTCPTLWDPMDCSPPGSFAHGDSPGKNTGIGCHALFQGIFPTQGSNTGLLHCRQILYHLSHEGSPKILEWVAYPFSRGTSWPRNWTGVSRIAGRYFTSWSPLMAIHAGNDQPEKYVFALNKQNISWGFVKWKFYFKKVNLSVIIKHYFEKLLIKSSW